MIVVMDIDRCFDLPSYAARSRNLESEPQPTTWPSDSATVTGYLSGGWAANQACAAFQRLRLKLIRAGRAGDVIVIDVVDRGQVGVGGQTNDRIHGSANCRHSVL